MPEGDQPQGQPARPEGGAPAPPGPGAGASASGAATHTVPAAPPPVLADRRIPCPRCGELAEPGQEICLRCGARVGRAYRRPPSWRVPAALAALGVLLIGAGAGFGVAELTHKKDNNKTKPISLTPSRPVTPIPTTPLPTATTPPTTTNTTPQTTTPTTTNKTTTPPTGGAAPGAALTPWPPGTRGWTVVLTTSRRRAAAEAKARAAAKNSISAGVLRGAAYAGFGKNEWVAFMGVYDTRAAAARAAKNYAAKGFSGTPREVRPKKK